MDFDVKNKLYIAAAGAGKTTRLCELASDFSDRLKPSQKILMLTYTSNNQVEVKERIKSKSFQLNIKVSGWYEFLLRYWIKPYIVDVIPGSLDECLWIKLEGGDSTIIKGKDGKYYRTYSAGDNRRKFLDGHRIRSEKIAELAWLCYLKNKESIVEKISILFPLIIIDEAQDLAGYDFEIVNEICKFENVYLRIACDPRQTTYHTSESSKYKEYKGRIDIFATCKINTKGKKNIQIDTASLSGSFRCSAKICEFANIIMSEYSPMSSYQQETFPETGIVLLREDDVENYYQSSRVIGHTCAVLRWNINTVITNWNGIIENMGEVKGKTYDSVIIFLTGTMRKWLKNEGDLSQETRSKFYVAVTRARHYVALVVDNSMSNPCRGLNVWE